MLEDLSDIAALKVEIENKINEVKEMLEALPPKDQQAVFPYVPMSDDDDEENEPDLGSQLQGCYCNKKALKEILEAMHRNTKGRLFYQDHLLFERLYTEMDAGTDALGEHTLTYGGTLPAGLRSIAEGSTIEDTSYDPENIEGYFTYLQQVYNEHLNCLYDCMEDAEEIYAQDTMLIVQNEIALASQHLKYLIARVMM